VDTIAYVSAALIWIPLAIWVFAFVNWLIMGEIDLLTGILGIFAAVVIGTLAFKPPRPEFSPIAFLAVTAAVCAYPYIRNAIDSRELRSMDIELLAKAYDALGMRPNNPLAQYNIARRLYALGYPGHALKIAEAAIAHMPEQHFLEEHRVLKLWQATVTSPDHFRSVPCGECDALNPPGRTHCPRCGAPFLLDRVRGNVGGGTLGRKLLAGWIGLSVILAGIPLATNLAPGPQIVVIISLFGAAAVVLYLAFREDAGANA